MVIATINSSGARSVSISGVSPGRRCSLANGDLPAAVRTFDVHRGVQRDQRLREVAMIGGDAGVARTEHCLRAVEAAEGGTARSGVPLVAWPGSIAEIFAARALQDICAEAR